MSTALDATYAPWPESEPPGLVPGPDQADLRAALRAVLARHEKTGDGAFGSPLWRALVDDMSVTTLSVPDHRGGLGYGLTDAAVVLEECGRALVSEPVLMGAVVGVQALLAAPEGAADPLLADAMNGDSLVVVHLPARSTGSTSSPSGDVTAEFDGTGWVLRGTARDVVHGAEANVVIVAAQTAEGRRLFAVPVQGAVRTARRVVDPTRPRADVHLDSATSVPITDVADTDSVLADLAARATIGRASEHTGIADRMLEMTIEYVRTRHQFGRPVGSFQAVKHRLADLLLSLERARSASRHAAALYDSDPDHAAVAVAVAGAVCTEVVTESVAEAVQLHGGVGFTWEHPAHRYFRRAMGDEALFGDPEHHRRDLARLVGLNSVR